MIDFTLRVYKNLLHELSANKYEFYTFENFLKSTHKKSIILRHDIDKNPKSTLKVSEIENCLGIKASYYFRILPKSYNVNIIKKISNHGHEIGYHYEDLALTYKKIRNKKSKMDSQEFHDLLYEKAIESFDKNLKKLRKISHVKTICMHGSPLSKFDNRDLWKIYNYKDFGILGDPYFDLDFNEVLYLSDTGRCWDGSDFSVRDKVTTKYNFKFRSTFDIIKNIDKLPNKIMLSIHPQRWNDKFVSWLSEYISQNIKNVIKKYFFVIKDNKSITF